MYTCRLAKSVIPYSDRISLWPGARLYWSGWPVSLTYPCLPSTGITNIATVPGFCYCCCFGFSHGFRHQTQILMLAWHAF